MSLEPFERVVVRHGPTVLRVCRALLRPADADDAWQETFLSALKAYPRLAAGSNIEAWLVTIAHRKAIDQHRARRRSAIPVASVGESGVAGTSASDHSDVHEGLWQLLAQLPAKQRAAVAYHHVAGLPYAQVAEILGNTESAARRAAADGIKTLRATAASTPR